MIRSSSCAVAPWGSSSTGSMPTRRRIRFEAESNTRISGPAMVRYSSVDRASRSAIASAFAMARFFGASSPSTIWMIVANSNARMTETDTLTACGTPAEPSRSSRPAPR